MPGLIAIAQVLAFLGTVGATLLAAALVIGCLMLRRTRWAQLATIAGVSVPGLYLVALVSSGALSNTSTLPGGARKVFCEIDCHVAFDVVSAVDRDGDTVRLTLREEFRRNSIGPARGDGPLTPGERYVALVDEHGRRYVPDRVHPLQAAPLFAPMRPGEQHRAELRFVVPSGVALRGLLVETDDPISRVLIGHERSPFHGKVLLSVASNDVAVAHGPL
jgi:hypothetical protein